MRLSEIQAADPKAVVVNGYYSGYLGEEMSMDELAAGVRHHYENGLSNICLLYTSMANSMIRFSIGQEAIMIPFKVL